MEYVGFVLFLWLLIFVLWMFGGKMNVAWMLCFICTYRSCVEGIDMYSIPASIFAIAGAIINLKGDAKKNDQS